MLCVLETKKKSIKPLSDTKKIQYRRNEEKQEKGLVVKPLLFKEIYARGQVIDMQTCPDPDYKYILTFKNIWQNFWFYATYAQKPHRK